MLRKIFAVLVAYALMLLVCGADSIVVLAHELFCALTWFARLEAGDAPPANPRVDMRDRDAMAEQDCARREQQRYTWISEEIDGGRRAAAKLAGSP